MEEKGYNRVELAKEVVILVPKLNSDQKNIYDIILGATTANQQELIFVYGHGGTGKTFLWKTLISALRSQGKIDLAVASSGASKAEIIGASIAELEMWPHFKICTLKENMRLLQPGMSEDKQKMARLFTSWLLDIGDGKIEEMEDNNNSSSSWITIPEEYFIPDDDAGLSNLIGFIYNHETLQKSTSKDLQQKVILSRIMD
ncbi:DNA helicase [Tanacetum coccineum]